MIVCKLIPDVTVIYKKYLTLCVHHVLGSGGVFITKSQR